MASNPLGLSEKNLEESWQWDSGDAEELYILEEEIASGSFGSVYKAKDKADGKIIALKIIKPEEDDEVSEFVELGILKKCDHENVVRLYGTWKKDDEIFVSIWRSLELVIGLINHFVPTGSHKGHNQQLFIAIR
jgi:serine/threonine protein kinase